MSILSRANEPALYDRTEAERRARGWRSGHGDEGACIRTQPETPQRGGVMGGGHGDEGPFVLCGPASRSVAPVAEPVWIGIDPGVSGAVAVIYCGEAVFHGTPTRKATKGQAYLPAEMVNLLRGYRVGAFAVLEQVSAARTAGGAASGNTSGSLKIGHGAGLWEGILAALEIPYEIVTPQAWKKALGLPVGSDKEASRAKAQALFPASAVKLTKGRARPDLAEALLMAEYGRRRITGEAK